MTIVSEKKTEAVNAYLITNSTERGRDRQTTDREEDKNKHKTDTYCLSVIPRFVSDPQ